MLGAGIGLCDRLGLWRRLWHLATRSVGSQISLIFLGLGCLLLIAAAPPAGSLVPNQATATYFNTATGFPERLLSNIVRFRVLPQEALSLTQDQSVQRVPGRKVHLPHRLTNAGNTPITITLSLANGSGDDYDLNELVIHHDGNGNSKLDSGERVFSPSSTVWLDLGASINLGVEGFIPDAVPVGQQAMLLLTATSLGQGVQVSNTDTILTEEDVILEVSKQASTATPQPGASITFTLSARNTGQVPATGKSVLLDGVSTALVVLLDPLPDSTTWVNLETPDVGTPLYHLAGTPADSYLSSPPTDRTQVDAIGTGVVTLPPGGLLPLQFTLAIHANASGPLLNTGHVDYHHKTQPSRVNSNTVTLDLPTRTPTISYYTDDNFDTLAPALQIGSPLFVQANAATCNTDSVTIETQLILITSAFTGDVESLIATETGPNTGVFRIIPAPLTQDRTIHPMRPGNKMLETLANDSLTAILEGCGTTIVQTTVLIDPFGVVFDSRTNEPIAGAIVTLIDVTGQGNHGEAGTEAVVFQDDGFTPAPSTLSTPEAGTFAFPLVGESRYRLEIIPPNGYIYPSVVAPAFLPPGRLIHPEGSYGGYFEAGASSGPVRLDIPLDREAVGGLFVRKHASKSVVEVGEFLDYTVEVKNTHEATLLGLTLTDTLPLGFALQSGSVRLDQTPSHDPDGSPGAVLSFALGDIAPNTTVSVTYRLKVGPGALHSDGINRAQAHTVGPLSESSNLASTKVEVRGDVFTDQGFIIGKVFVDCNDNHLQDTGEPGIPNVRLYLENGTFALTDAAGKYSFFGISPHTHVLKVDDTTLPLGSILVPLSQRHGGEGGSRFVDLKSRELHKADFAEGSCTPAIRQAVEGRRQPAQQPSPETERNLKTQLRPAGEAESVIDPRSRPASGYLDRDGTLPSADAESPQHPLETSPSPSPTLAAPAVPPSTPTVAAAPAADLMQALATLDNALGFIEPQDGDTLAIPQTHVRIKGPAGAIFHLEVNGTAVPESRVGQKSVLDQQQIQAWEYIGVNLTPGSNTLEVIQYDPFGNERGRHAMTVVVPDKLNALHIELPTERLEADGVTPVWINVKLEDDQRVPVTIRTPVTLEASGGMWQVPDLIPSEPGTQVLIEEGMGTFALLPPHEPGKVRLRVTSGLLQTETHLTFLPKLRPLLAVGVIEGTINMRHFDPKSLVPAQAQDRFERELRNLSFSEDQGQIRGGGRAAFFLKGKVKGDYLLTMAYDSDKDTQEQLFRDIQPDRFYPVYGDSSVRGFDAQSTGQFFVRVDKNATYLLYGDFTTQTLDVSRRLGQYSRSLTGPKLHYENSRARVNIFGSRDDTRQAVEEIPARGISGPYLLSNTDFVENSERVEILVRDRSQPSIIISTTPQTRFEDYEIDALSGSLLFRAPVPSLDPDLNPIFIRVTYEVDQGGEDFWVAGVDGQVRVTNFLEVGGGYTRDENPEAPLDMVSGNATLQLSQDTYLIGEIAHTDRSQAGSGLGWRTELRHRNDRLTLKIEASRTDGDFDNPSASLGRGRVEVRTKALYKLTKRTQITGEVLHTEDLVNSGKRDGGELTVRQHLGHNTFVELGARHARETSKPAQSATSGATPFESTSMRLKFGAPVPYLPTLSLYGEYEQEVSHLDRRVAAVGGEYRVLQRGRVYARHEFISSLAGRFSLNSGQAQHITLVGADIDYIRNGQVFSEYRIRDAINGPDAQAAIGLRHRFRLAEGIYLNAGFERLQTVKGNQNGDSTALTSALAYTAHERWKGTMRLELRESRGAPSLLHTLGLAYALHRDWTFLGKHTLAWDEDSVRERLRIGAAFRDHDTNVWHGLFRYEFRYEQHDRQATERYVHILATHLNYQPIQPATFSAYAATKWVMEDFNDIHSTANTHLLSSRLTYDIAKRWDIGLMGSALFSSSFDSVEYGLGLEGGLLISDNLWLSAGYNVSGFHDEELSDVNYTNRGFFLRFRYKFDEEFIAHSAHTVATAFGRHRSPATPRSRTAFVND